MPLMSLMSWSVVSTPALSVEWMGPMRSSLNFREQRLLGLEDLKRL